MSLAELLVRGLVFVAVPLFLLLTSPFWVRVLIKFLKAIRHQVLDAGKAIEKEVGDTVQKEDKDA